MKTQALDYHSTPRHIKAIKFMGKETEYDGLEIIEDVDFGGNPTGEFLVYNELQDSYVQVKIGDFIRVDLEGDYYPIDKDYFKENYTLASPTMHIPIGAVRD